MEEPATTASVLLAADALPTGLVADTPADGRAASYASRLDAACRAWNMNGDGNGEIASDPLLTRLDEQAFFDVWGDGEGWDGCAFAEAYRGMWEAIDADPWASTAIKYALASNLTPQWPPGIEDIVGVYTSLVGTPEAHFAAQEIIGQEATRSQGLARLVRNIGALYRRRTENRMAAYARRTTMNAQGSLTLRAIMGDWPRAVDPRCDPDDDTLYLVLAERGSRGATVHLVAVTNGGAEAHVLGSMAPDRDFVGDLDALPPAARPYAAFVPWLLDGAGLPDDEIDVGVGDAVLAVRAIMALLPSWADLPPAVLDAVRPWSPGRIMRLGGRSKTWAAWIDACSLALLLSQMAGADAGATAIQLYRPDMRPPTDPFAPVTQVETLMRLAHEAAVGATEARFDPTGLPMELAEPLAFDMWRRTCALPTAERGPDGRLVGADRLLDVAALWASNRHRLSAPGPTSCARRWRPRPWHAVHVCCAVGTRCHCPIAWRRSLGQSSWTRWSAARGAAPVTAWSTPIPWASPTIPDVPSLAPTAILSAATRTKRRRNSCAAGHPCAIALLMSCSRRMPMHEPVPILSDRR